MASDLKHHGIKGQKWGVRRFQNEDGSLTTAGERRYGGVTGIASTQKPKLPFGVKDETPPKGKYPIGMKKDGYGDNKRKISVKPKSTKQKVDVGMRILKTAMVVNGLMSAAMFALAAGRASTGKSSARKIIMAEVLPYALGPGK